SIKGVSSQVLVCADENMTVAVLTNIANVDAEDLAMTAMQYALNAKDEEQVPVQQATVHVHLEQYVGYYQSLEGSSVDIMINNDQLTLRAGQDSFMVKPLGNNLFIMDNGKKIAFTTNDTGKVTGLYYSVRYLPKAD